MKSFKLAALLTLACLLPLGCATGKDMSSEHFLPEWKNRLVYLPNPSESSGGYWARKAAHQIAKGIERTVFFPFAIAGNVAANAYFIPTWPFRYFIRGDKRLIVWYPMFHVGEDAPSEYFSQQWNQDLA